MKYVYKSVFYDTSGVEQIIKILDLSAVYDVENTFDCSDVNLQYNNDGGEILTPIISSQFSFVFLVENSTHYNFLLSISQSTGGRFYVEFYRGGTLSFFGQVNITDFTVDDEYYPYYFQITANDGLSLLKDIPFNYIPKIATIKPNLLSIINYCLLKLDLVSNYYIGIYSYLKTCSNWKAANQQTSTDVFLMSRIFIYIFSETVENGTADFSKYSCYEVLEFILTRFNSRLFYANGHYHIIQISSAINDFNDYRFYDTNLTFKELRTLNVKKVPARLEGGQFSYLNPLKKVTQKYIGLAGFNVLPKYIGGDVYNSFQKSYPVNSGDTFLFSTNVRIDYNTLFAPSFSEIREHFRIYIKTDNFSLGKDTNGNPEWKNNTTSYFQTTSAVFDANFTGGIYYYFELELPAMPEDCEFEIKLEILGFQNAYDITNTILSYPTNYIKGRYLSDYRIAFPDISKQTEITFKTEITSNSKYTYELNEQLIGDSEPFVLVNSLEVWNGSSWGISGGFKDITNILGSTSIDIFSLAAFDLLNMQKTPVKVYSGGLIVNSSFLNYITTDGLDFVLISGTYNYNMGEWSNIEMFAIDKATFTRPNLSTINTNNYIPVEVDKIKQNSKQLYTKVLTAENMLINGANSFLIGIPDFSDLFTSGRIYKDENGFLKII